MLLIILLIKDDAGEIDWDTLGKILSAHILGEVNQLSVAAKVGQSYKPHTSTLWVKDSVVSTWTSQAQHIHSYE